MKLKSVLFFVFCLIMASCQTNRTEKYDLEYIINYNIKNGSTLDVQFKYRTDDKGILNLDYVNSSSGDNDIFNCIQKLKVENVKANISYVRDSNLIKIKSIPNKELVISYSIKQDFNGSLYNHHRYRPIITNDYFHILGVRLFIVPSSIYKSEEDFAKIHVNWYSIPNNGIIHNSFGLGNSQTFTVSQENLFGSFFVGGDFRRHQFSFQNKPVYFVTRGKWENFSDNQIFDVLKETIVFQNKFWKDSITERFSVSLLPTEEKKSYSIGGSGFSNSFVSYASNNQFTDIKGMSWLYNHELLHRWVSRTIKNENEVEQYWFSEGFTDYYAYKLQLKNDKISLEEYIKTFNKILRLHTEDKINHIPNSQLTFENYWGHYSKYQKLPYRRGLLYAFLLDTQIKNEHNFRQSLDDLMLEVLDLAKENSSFRINNKSFKTLIIKYLDKKAIADFEKYILNGELIDFENQLVNGLKININKSIPQFILSPSVNPEQIKKDLKI